MKSVIKTLLIASFCLVSCNEEDVNSLKEQNDKLQKKMDELVAAQETKEEVAAPEVGILALKLEEAEKLLDQKEYALANYQTILLTLADLEKREAAFSELNLRYPSKHPKVITAKNALDEYRSRFLREFDQVRNATADKDYWDKNQSEWNQQDLDQLSRLQIARRLLTARATALVIGIESQRKVYNSFNTQLAELNTKKGETAVEVAQGTKEEKEAFVVAIKAPREGEAFITLSDEVRPLGDAEIMFFGSDFAKDFETFRDNLIAETKDKQKSRLTRAMSDTRKELERLENSMASIAEATRESENKALQEKRVGISKKILNLEEKLKESDPLVESLNKYFSSYTQLETSLVQAANVTRDKAHQLGVDLILKVNKAIVSEGISIPKYPQNHQSDDDLRRGRPTSHKVYGEGPKPIVALSLSHKFNRVRRLSSQQFGLVGVSLQMTQTTLSAGNDPRHFFIKNITSYNSQQILGVCSYFFPAELNNSKIASEMRKALLLIFDYKKELENIVDKLKKNNDTINNKFQVYANSIGTSTDSITERLLERESIERAIPSLNEELNKLKDGSEESVKAINFAIQKAELALKEEIKNVRTALVMGKEMLSVLSGPEFQKILSEPEKTTMQEEIKKFLASNKLRSVRTGSDGKFSVPQKARYASSFVIRKAWGREFFWLIKIGLEERSVILSDSNISKVGRNGALLGALDYEFE